MEDRVYTDGKSIVCDKRTHLHAGHNTCIAECSCFEVSGIGVKVNVAVLHKGNREKISVFSSSFQIYPLFYTPPSARVVTRRAYDRIGVGGGTDDAAGSLSRP